MSDEILVRVESVSKKFCRSLKKSLWYGFYDAVVELTGRQSNHELRSDEFWAIQDVSFELRRGECLGLIGPNGAGKSTLLKMLNGLIKPDKGRIEMHGRVGALIELGTGFNPVLTGRENIYNNAAVLGFKKSEIDKKLESIIDFSEIGEFIDMPIQSYSSGMKVRLGFAVAAQLEPDILIIDEVLAVGDVGFRAKCYNKIFQMASNSCVIFISHSMPQISRLCTMAALLKKGELVSIGKDVWRNIQYYLDCFTLENSSEVLSNNFRLGSFKINGKTDKEIDCTNIHYLDNLRIEIKADLDKKHEKIEMNIGFLSQSTDFIAQCNSIINQFDIWNKSGSLSIEVEIPKICLNSGVYYISLSIHDASTNEILYWHHAKTKLRIIGSFHGGAPLQFMGHWR